MRGRDKRLGGADQGEFARHRDRVRDDVHEQAACPFRGSPEVKAATTTPGERAPGTAIIRSVDRSPGALGGRDEAGRGDPGCHHPALATDQRRPHQWPCPRSHPRRAFALLPQRRTAPSARPARERLAPVALRSFMRRLWDAPLRLPPQLPSVLVLQGHLSVRPAVMP